MGWLGAFSMHYGQNASIAYPDVSRRAGGIQPFRGLNEANALQFVVIRACRCVNNGT